MDEDGVIYFKLVNGRARYAIERNKYSEFLLGTVVPEGVSENHCSYNKPSVIVLPWLPSSLTRQVRIAHEKL